ncbi:unnamed protein product [Protopolystoma xenopodis]|uniref:EF-hand domain-containing protein n=1 Tax=Protopolystoma xenopodis TaxID=117903 RepID=A0A448XAP4_9PLAT|nr:unnamed protein product [Protopolystoma xenopodis]
MMEKIFRAMSRGNILTYDDWIYGMNIFLRGSFLQMANFAFTVYDQQKRGYLTKEDIQFYLKDVLVVRITEEDADELYTDMVDMVLGLMDKDRDGVISRKDFVQSVMAEPLLIEALGECLPNSKSVLTIESLIRQGKERVHISYQPKKEADL